MTWLMNPRLLTASFAGDTNVCCSGKQLSKVVMDMNEGLGSWMAMNKLSLNVDKTKLSVFNLRKSYLTSPFASIKIEEKQRESDIRFWGVFIYI